MADAPRFPPGADVSAGTTRTGILYALAAYGWWGSVVPVYFWMLSAVPVWDLLALRILLGLPLMAVLLSVGRQWSALARVGRSRAAMKTLPITALLLAANWIGFIYAIVSGRALEASLGYYVTPLVSVALGAIFLGERLSRRQLVTVLLAVAGVGVMAIEAMLPAAGHTVQVPWIAVVLAGSFGFYGLLRKQADVPPMVGLTMEMMLLLPLAAAAFLYRSLAFDAAEALLDLPARLIVLLAITGVVTLAPLIWFAAAAARLPLATVGLLQYIAPTGQFVLALFLFDESLTIGRKIGFLIVLVAVALYCIDLAATARRARQLPADAGRPDDGVDASVPGPAPQPASAATPPAGRRP